MKTFCVLLQELIEALKNYGEFFNVQLHTKTDFDYDSFVSSFSK